MNVAELSKEELVELNLLLMQKVSSLEERLRLLVLQKFQKTSESISPDQLKLLLDKDDQPVEEDTDDAAEKDDEIITVEYQRRRGKRQRCLADLPRERVEYDLPDEEKICACGAALKKIGEQTSEQYDIIPQHYRVIEHVQHKYACSCCEGQVKVASKTPHILPKCNATPRLLAHIATTKFVDSVPLHRQEKQFERGGLRVPRNTMARWLIALSKPLMALINLLEDAIRAGPYQQCDESPIQVHREQDRDNTAQSWVWVRRGGVPGREVILFHYSASRSSAVVKQLFDAYQGYVQCDGYCAYHCLEAQGCTLVGCMAHVRRKFNNALKSLPGKESAQRSKAAMAMSFIQRLYRIEHQIKWLTAHEKQQQRQTESMPILIEFKAWLEKQVVLPKSTLGRAINYTLNQWEKVIRYCNDGHLDIDNNSDERAIKSFAVGRKNWLFADSPQGAQTNAVFYSLIETSKLHGLNEFAYLIYVFKELPKAKCVEDIEALLPWNIDKESIKALTHE